MNILDENIPNSQRQLLRSWRIRIHQVGHEIGRQGMKDEEIIPLLHGLPPVTFFTRDLCHDRYSLVCLGIGQYEVASFVRRFLRHTAFNTRAKRVGKVIRVSHAGMRMWQLHAEKEKEIGWL